MLLDRASWDEIEDLEPIQQWCAYYLWDRRQWVDFHMMHTQAAAAMGDAEAANKGSSQVAELMFPYVAEDRRKFYEDSSEGLAAMRGIAFRIRRAD